MAEAFDSIREQKFAHELKSNKKLEKVESLFQQFLSFDERGKPPEVIEHEMRKVFFGAMAVSMLIVEATEPDKLKQFAAMTLQGLRDVGIDVGVADAFTGKVN